MKKIMTKTALVPMMIWVASMTLTQSCIDEVQPTSYATDDQIENSTTTAQSLVNGLNAMMVDQFTYNGTEMSYDWGYPCQMVLRDVLGGDEPVVGNYSDGSYNDYLYWIANGGWLNVPPLYTYSYYYDLISNANLVVKMYADEASDYKEYGGMGLVYRALAYLDITRMFEYRTTGFESLDGQATEVKGLTVPIVTEKTTVEESKNNPRAPFYTMYRFIMDDLNRAETLLTDYERSTRVMPDVSVVYGLKARLWLEMASRFDQSSDDLATFTQHQSDNDGYGAISVSTAKNCYAKAYEYAQKAMGCNGYSPLTQSEWHDNLTGFNTANHAWMWAASLRNKEMLTYIWYSWLCWMSPESSNFCWGPTFDTYRAIDAGLFNSMSDSDLRKKSWIDPEDAGSLEVPDGYSTILTNSEWAALPAYTGLKFRLNNGEQSDFYTGLLFDIPLMRIEEMSFIAAEAIAHVSGVTAGKTVLEGFMNTYRYTDGSYQCSDADMETFMNDLLTQKRVEFWGEGLTFFDNKRLARKITRWYDGTNYPSSYQLNSKSGYVAPWLNYYIYDFERDDNPAVILNPDPTDAVAAQTDYDY